MMATAEQYQQWGDWILLDEARRDRSGHLMVYELPSGDGGGTARLGLRAGGAEPL